MNYDFPKYPSIKIASADIGVPLDTLRALQRLPAPGFKSGRVDSRQLLAFLLGAGAKPDIGEDSVQTWRKRLIAAQAGREELRLGAESMGLIKRSDVCEAFSRLGGEIHAIRLTMENEGAVALAGAGSDIALNRTELRKMWDQILLQFQETSKHFDDL